MLPEYVKYYYDKLPEPKKKVYLQMYKGFRAHQKSVMITADHSVISPDDLLYIFTCLYNDTPSFYFLEVNSTHQAAVTSVGYVFSTDFQYTEAEIERYDKALVRGLQVFRDRYIREDMTAFEKETVIHDYLVGTVIYDEESLKTKEEMTRHGEIFNVLGPLLRKKAVCWGIACAFKLICDYCGVKCFVAIGKAVHSGTENSSHAWNIVRLDNENYHVDVTWDIRRKGDISFSRDYLNLNDSLIRLDHTWDDRIYPPCGSLEYNYHHRNHLYVRTLREIPEFVRKAVRSGDRYVTFKFANEMPSAPELVNEISRGMEKARYRRKYQYAINMDTHNVYIDLQKEEAQNQANGGRRRLWKKNLRFRLP